MLSRLEVDLSRDISGVWAAGHLGGMADGQLLDRFARRGDAEAEAAFSVLVARHGPMVRAVVRKALGDRHAAEDAFQATFLVLARKAGSIGRPEALAPWLHGVAIRVARKARSQAARRLRHEAHAAGLRAARADQAVPDDGEIGTALHDEVARLPESYRMPVLLCYFRGMSYVDAADQLGVTESAIRGRLARARGLLRRRLAGREGLAPSAVHMSCQLPGISAGLAGLTARVATRFARGHGATSAAGSELAIGVIRAMSLTKLLSAIVLVALPIAFAARGFALPWAEQSPSLPSRDNAGDESRASKSRGPGLDGGTRQATEPTGIARPILTVKLTGHGFRHPDQTNEYKLLVTNAGSGPAKDIRIRVSMPRQGGRLLKIRDQAKFDKRTREILKGLDRLEPSQSVELSFVYSMGGPGAYRTTAEVIAEGTRAGDTHLSEVAAGVEKDAAK